MKRHHSELFQPSSYVGMHLLSGHDFPMDDFPGIRLIQCLKNVSTCRAKSEFFPLVPGVRARAPVDRQDTDRRLFVSIFGISRRRSLKDA